MKPSTLLLALTTAPLFAFSATITVSPDEVLAEISPNIYGLGMEDVNHEIYGGLDAQRLYGESFEEPANPYTGKDPIWGRLKVSNCWEALGGQPGELIHDTQVAHWGQASQAMKPNGANVGMCNRGLGNAGIPVHKGRALIGHLYLRGTVSALEVYMMEGKGGKRVSTTVHLTTTPGGNWQKVDFKLMGEQDETAARFVVFAYGYGTVWIDDAYLADEPTNEFGRIGCREDVVAGLQQAGVNFLRWGGTMCNAEDYNLNTFDGRSRKPYRGFWHPISSGGFGPREFVRLAATMKVPCAVSISAREEVSEAVKFAEELRQYDIPIVVEIGNEEIIWSNVPAARKHYCELVRTLVPAMRKANPKLQFATALWWMGLKSDFEMLDGVVEYWDLHPYFPEIPDVLRARGIVRDFMRKIRQWNPKTTMRAAVFEENGTRHDMSRALCHALMLEEIRAAGKDVLTSSPANAFQVWKQNDNGWNQGNVFMTPDKVWLAPCGWSQRMARDGHRELLIVSACDDKDVHVSATRNRQGDGIVLHIVNPTATPKPLSFAIKGKATPTVTKAVTLAGKDLSATNTPEAPAHVVPTDVTREFGQSMTLKPWSYTVVTL